MRSFAPAKDVLRISPWNVFGEDIAHDRLSEARISDSGHETKRGGGHGGRRVGRGTNDHHNAFCCSEISVIPHHWMGNELHR